MITKPAVQLNLPELKAAERRQKAIGIMYKTMFSSLLTPHLLSISHGLEIMISLSIYIYHTKHSV